MECPNEDCSNTTDFNVVANQRCITTLSFKDGELVSDETEIKQAWHIVEPEFVVCAECDYTGKPEEFGLYSGKLLRNKLARLIDEALENDTLAALPDQLMSLVHPQGGILIHKGRKEVPPSE